jgi:hypothetical protein
MNNMNTQYANLMGYTDVRAYEIVGFKTERKALVRRLNATLKESFKPNFIVGGFSGICTNQYQQEYEFSQNTEYLVRAIRLHKDGEWRDSYGNLYKLSDSPQEFYDYNF